MERDLETTPLIDAVRAGDLVAVEQLVASGASVNQAKADGNTPLTISVQERHTAITEFLLEKEVNVDVLNVDEWSPLLIATFKGFAKEVELLLGKGAEMNRVYHSQKWTVLALAAYNNDLDITTLLLERGADPMLGLSPITSAADRGHFDMVKFLLQKKVRINTWDADGRTSLITALKRGHTDIAKLLMENGANVDMWNMTGEYPITTAVHTQNLRAVNLLLTAGANPFSVICPVKGEIGAAINDSKLAFVQAQKGNLAFFTEAIERGALPAPHRQWYYHDKTPYQMSFDLREWISCRKDGEYACYMAFHRGAARGTLHRLREFDDLRRRVTGFLVDPFNVRDCMLVLSGRKSEKWD